MPRERRGAGRLPEACCYTTSRPPGRPPTGLARVITAANKSVSRMKTQTSSSPWRWRAGCPEGYDEDQFETEYEDMTGKSNSQKLDFLYALSARINEVAVIADRMGYGEVGQNVLDIMDFAAAEIGLPKDYKDGAIEGRLVNEGLQDLIEEYPEECTSPPRQARSPS